MKLPEITNESKTVVHKFGKYEIKFRKIDMGTLMAITKKQAYRDASQEDKTMHMLAACLDPEYENTDEEKFEFVKKIEFDSIGDLNDLIDSLGISGTKKKSG